jgi:hypothetical protein
MYRRTRRNPVSRYLFKIFPAEPEEKSSFIYISSTQTAAEVIRILEDQSPSYVTLISRVSEDEMPFLVVGFLDGAADPISIVQVAPNRNIATQKAIAETLEMTGAGFKVTHVKEFPLVSLG